MAATGNEAGAPDRLRLAHRDRRAGHGARLPLHLQRRLERHLQRHRHRPHQPLRPDRREVPRAASRTAAPASSCHDNNVLLNVGGTHHQLRHVRGRQRPRHVQVRPDAARPTPTGRRREADAAVVAVDAGVTTGHSGSFTYDGKYLIYGHEPGGGSAARCQATSTIVERTLFFIDPLTGDDQGRRCCTRARRPAARTARGTTSTSSRPRPATTRRSGQLPVGHLGLRVHQPGGAARDRLRRPGPAPEPDPPPATGIVLGGDWSTYWHNGYIYESDIKRGVITWQLNLGADATATQANEHLKRTNTFALSNPQTQAVVVRA